MSYSSIVPCTAVARVQARLMIFTMCSVEKINGVIVGMCVDVYIFLVIIGASLSEPERAPH